MEVRFELHLKIQTRLRDGRERSIKSKGKQHERKDQDTEGMVKVCVPAWDGVCTSRLVRSLDNSRWSQV